MSLEAHFGERTINELLLIFRHRQINLDPGFQRNSVWSELDRRRLVNLLNSGSFASTHGYIAKLSKQQEFSLAQVEQLIEIPESNNQVGWIIDDGDVHNFYKSLLKNYSDKMQAHIATKLAQLVAKGEPVADGAKNA